MLNGNVMIFWMVVVLFLVIIIWLNFIVILEYVGSLWCMVFNIWFLMGSIFLLLCVCCLFVWWLWVMSIFVLSNLW